MQGRLSQEQPAARGKFDSLGRTLGESFKFGFLSSAVNMASTNWVKNLSSFTDAISCGRA
jgi:hypothetical protein